MEECSAQYHLHVTVSIFFISLNIFCKKNVVKRHSQEFISDFSDSVFALKHLN